MTFEQYVKRCQDILEHYPEFADAEAVCKLGRVNENKTIHPVYFSPSVGYVDEDYEWHYEDDGFKKKAVCL